MRKQNSFKRGDAAHMEKLNHDISDVRRVVKIISERKSKLDRRILRRGALVLFTACWEAFIEDLASASFEFILKNCSGHKNIPDPVKRLSVKDLCNSKDGVEMWTLAGHGWKKVLHKHKKRSVEKFVGGMNTPKSENN